MNLFFYPHARILSRKEAVLHDGVIALSKHQQPASRPLHSQNGTTPYTPQVSLSLEERCFSFHKNMNLFWWQRFAHSILITSSTRLSSQNSQTMSARRPISKTFLYKGDEKPPEGVTHVDIHESLTSIEEGAFNECSSLTSITIPTSVTSIERVAFYGCSSLVSITISPSVTEIGHLTKIADDAFEGCPLLEEAAEKNGVDVNAFVRKMFFQWFKWWRNSFHIQQDTSCKKHQWKDGR